MAYRSEVVTTALEQIEAARLRIRKELVGRRAIVTSEYNGQPHGRSRPSMKGRKFMIEDAHEDAGQISIVMPDELLYLGLDEVRILD